MAAGEAGDSPGARLADRSEGRQYHIVIFNWRDSAHPHAGGAEKVTHEIARRWVAWGHRVTLFTATFPGAAYEEMVDGVHVIRRGSQRTVHWEAYRYYVKHGLRDSCDLIIDEVNTIPFFTPLYVRKPVIMYSNQLAREVWRYEAPFPLSTVGYFAEPLYLQAYRRTPIMTISRSTQNDLRRLGLSGPYYVIPMAVDTRAPDVLPPLDSKEAELTLAFVGRVVPSKRVDHIIRALALIRHARPHARLWIIGSWDEAYRQELDSLIADLGLTTHVTFFGHVDTATKEELMARAHLIVMTSVREGWGLVVTEGNILGTPSVVYDVPGLRDSTRHGETGLVCSRNTPAELARGVIALAASPSTYEQMRYHAWKTAKELQWDQTARVAWGAVEACL